MKQMHWRRYVRWPTAARLLLLGLCTTQLAAQNAPGQAGDGSKAAERVDEEVVVTGSRIQRPEADSPIPLVSIGEESIAMTGSTNLAEVVNELPGLGLPSFNSSQSNLDNVNIGINSLQLRGLGDGRTLVLVNGRRLVSSQPGSQIADISVVPVDMVERVEVLTGGASAVYGSDALAGVVNFILRDDFEGVRIRSQFGASDRGDGQTQTVSGTFGLNSADGRGNFVVNLFYEDIDQVLATDRAFSAVDILRDFETGELLGPFLDGFVPGGRFAGTVAGGNVATVGRTVTPFSLALGNGAVRPYDPSGDGINRQIYRQLIGTSRRLQAAFSGHHEVVSNLDWFVEGLYSQVESASEREPVVVTNYSRQPNNGLFPIQAGIPLTNPYVPAMLLADAQAAGADYIGFFRSFPELGQREFDSERQTLHVATGLRAALPWRDWRAEASILRSRMTQEARVSNQINAQALRYAVDAVVDPTTGSIVCNDPVARAQGCVPVDLFGPNSISAAGIDYIRADAQRDAVTEVESLAAHLTGSLLDLPAGPLGLVAGAEWRTDSAQAISDPLWLTYGILNIRPNPDLDAEIDVSEVFAELDFPLLRDVPFARYAAIDAAVRLADYSTIGNVSAWKIGALWEPVSGLRFRGVMSQAIKAPTIFQAFGEGGVTVPGNITDLCSGVTATSARAQDAGCRADPGIAAAIAATGSYFISPQEQRDIVAATGGNAGLTEETADTRTFGFVLQPSALPGFSLSADYYSIEIEDYINRVQPANSQRACYTQGVLCDLLTRSASGTLVEVDVQFRNLNAYETSGIDVAAGYRTGLERLFGENAGTLAINSVLTWTDNLEFISSPGSSSVESGTVLFPKYKARAQISYERASVMVGWTTRYIHSAALMDGLELSFPAQDGVSGSEIPSYWYHDAQLRMSFMDRHELHIGVNNVFGKDPPLVGTDFGADPNTLTYSQLYDVIGRYYYAGIALRF